MTTLTIRDVTEEDLQSFDCILIDDHFEEGHVRKTIFLSLSGKQTIKELVLRIGGYLCVFLL